MSFHANDLTVFSFPSLQFQHSDLDQSEVDNNCKKLSLAITMLNQLITNFLHCYESELRHWCNRPKAKKSG